MGEEEVEVAEAESKLCMSEIVVRLVEHFESILKHDADRDMSIYVTNNQSSQEQTIPE